MQRLEDFFNLLSCFEGGAWTTRRAAGIPVKPMPPLLARRLAPKFGPPPPKAKMGPSAKTGMPRTTGLDEIGAPLDRPSPAPAADAGTDGAPVAESVEPKPAAPVVARAEAATEWRGLGYYVFFHCQDARKGPIT